MLQLPENLTRDILLKMMQDERYTNPNHPEHQGYAEMISAGFKKLYGDQPAAVDATGKLINPDG